MLISNEFREVQRKLHEVKKNYGNTGVNYADQCLSYILKWNLRDMLDYGCGKGTLKEALARQTVAKIYEYDPAIPGKDSEPPQVDFVHCSDVLEHVEPETIDPILDHIQHLARRLVFIMVHTGPAQKHFPDGRNLHITQRQGDFWLPKFMDRWRIIGYNETELHGLSFLGLTYETAANTLTEKQAA